MESLTNNIIPKKIHYCWFGKGQKNQLFYKCYKTWKQFFPDFEIIEWNEDNFDINSNIYVKEAYERKKWAFVSDYARLKILYDEGGIYFDTDVEVLKKFDNSIIEAGYFAKEDDNHISTGLGFGVYPKNKIIKYMMEDYESIHFCKDDGTLDLTACPKRNTDSLTKKGYIVDEQNLPLENVPVYSKEYFCGFDINTQSYIISNKTYTVHHYNASWSSWHERTIHKFKKKISKFIGPEKYAKIGNFLHHRR